MSFLKSPAKPSVAPEAVDVSCRGLFEMRRRTECSFAISDEVQDPPDEPGHEMTGDARVWKTYVREADKSDKEMIEERSNSLDVLLSTFREYEHARDKPFTHAKALQAALFSAVSTAFLIESLGDLKPDPAESSAKTLLLMSQTLAAIANGQTVALPSSDALDEPPFSPSKTAVVVNLLWLLSLSLSIAVSLIAMLAKEWCYKFLASRVGPAYEQARRRQLKWNGMERWKMKEVLTYLPSMMHVALCECDKASGERDAKFELVLFAVGLCLYLWDISTGMAIPVITVTSIATLVYVLATILPTIDRFCPYSTPVPVIAIFVNAATFFADITKTNLFRTIRRVYVSKMEVPEYGDSFAHIALGTILSLPMFIFTIAEGMNLWVRVILVIPAGILSLLGLVPMIFCQIIWLLRALPAILLRLPVLLISLVQQIIPVTTIQLMLASLVRSITFQYKLGDAYSGSTKVPMDLVTSQMLAWLISNCENSRSVDIALQAIAGADNDLPGEPLEACGALKLALLRLKACTKLGGTSLTALQYYRASGGLVSGGVVRAAEDRWSRSPHPMESLELKSYRSSHSDHYDYWKTYQTYAYLIDRFSSEPDLNTRATVAITAIPFYHWNDEYGSRAAQQKILEIITTVLKEHLQVDSPELSNLVLTATVESTVHYLVGHWPDGGTRPATFNVLFILLSHIFFMSYDASPDTARAVAVTLAAAAFAADTYPGGSSPEVGEYDREKRAVDVYNHYHAQESLTADMVLELFLFGFSGLLPQIDFNDGSIRAVATLGNINQLILYPPKFDFSRNSTIYTLPQRYSLSDRVVNASRKSLISFVKDMSSGREVGLTFSGLVFLAHSSKTDGNDSKASLYILALIAVCRVESVEIQNLCLQFIDAQSIPERPLDLVESFQNRGRLEQLCRALIDCDTAVASVAALHFELLVARIIISTATRNTPSWISAGQSAIRPLLNLQDKFAERISHPKQLSIEALLSGLEKCCEGHSIADDHIFHTIQSVVDFCGAGPVDASLSDSSSQKLQALKDQLKPSSDRVAHMQTPAQISPLTTT
ncbi:hypothetical protein FRC12_012504 [Ceratobasidium sp. 428]|nr:hypothetical protein FRC12_012504 [Ceratobasidium sp. 428]